MVPLAGAGLASCGPAGRSSQGNQSTDPAARSPENAVALLGDEAVTESQLRQAWVEAAGGQVLAEWVLDRAVSRRLASQGVTLTPADLQRERDLFQRSLSTDAREAAELAASVRERRGLGPVRYETLIRRNAGLRRLVEPRVAPTPAQLAQGYELRHGPSFEARLIVTPTLREAQAALEELGKGAAFVDVVLRHSTDVSRRQGGLLPPVSPADESFPSAVRRALSNLSAGAVSDPVAIEGGFAILKLERVIPGDGRSIEAVREELEREVRLQNERIEMQRLARELLRAADVVVLDRGLKAGWEAARERALEAGP
jgi:foldase protein PrsA